MKLPSKRFIARLTVLSIVVALGGIAIAQAHFALKKSSNSQTTQTAQRADAADRQNTGAEAIADVREVADASAYSDPFPGSRLLPASHNAEAAPGPGYAPVNDAGYRGGSPAGGGHVAPAVLSTAVAAAAIGDTPTLAPAAETPQVAPDGSFRATPPPYADAPERVTDVGDSAEPTSRRPGSFGSGNVLRAAPPAMAVPPVAVGAAVGPGEADSQYRFPARPDGDSEYEPSAATTVPPGMDGRFAAPPAPPTTPHAAPYAAAPPMHPRANVAALPPRPDSAATLRADSAELSNPKEGSGTPGEPRLEGLQTPSIAIQKMAPEEIQIGKPARFATKVQNVGQGAATQVVVRDLVPKGTRLIDTSPPATQTGGGEIVWDLGTLEPNEEQMIVMQVMPITEGEIGSVATATFTARASVRTRCTKPELVLEHTAPRRVMAGSPVSFSIKLSNPGTGAATGIVLEEDVPKGLSHPAGSELLFEVGTLGPGETRELELTLNATEACLVENLLRARADGDLVSESTSNLEVIAPQLKLILNGPRLRYLERPANCKIGISNPGSAPAKDVEIVAILPKGVRFLETNNAGVYDSQRHAVLWSVAELPAQGGGEVQLSVVPLEAGEQKVRVEARAEAGLVDIVEHTVTVEGLASLFFDVADSADPIEVGKETLFEIRVLNEGSKTSENIQVVATLPPQMKPLSGEGATRGVVEGQTIRFAPLARLAPKADVMFKIRAQGLEPGYHRISVQIMSSEMQQPVTREESTLVYSDQ